MVAGIIITGTLTVLFLTAFILCIMEDDFNIEAFGFLILTNVAGTMFIVSIITNTERNSLEEYQQETTTIDGHMYYQDGKDKSHWSFCETCLNEKN